MNRRTMISLTGAAAVGKTVKADDVAAYCIGMPDQGGKKGSVHSVLTPTNLLVAIAIHEYSNNVGGAHDLEMRYEDGELTQTHILSHFTRAHPSARVMDLSTHPDSMNLIGDWEFIELQFRVTLGMVKEGQWETWDIDKKACTFLYRRKSDQKLLRVELTPTAHYPEDQIVHREESLRITEEEIPRENIAVVRYSGASIVEFIEEHNWPSFTEVHDHFRK